MALSGMVVELGWAPRGAGQMNMALGSSVSLTVPADTQAALIQAQGGRVRYRDDGPAPTGTSGIVLGAGSSLFYTGDLAAIKFIADDGQTSTISVLYYGWDD